MGVYTILLHVKAIAVTTTSRLQVRSEKTDFVNKQIGFFRLKLLTAQKEKHTPSSYVVVYLLSHVCMKLCLCRNTYSLGTATRKPLLLYAFLLCVSLYMYLGGHDICYFVFVFYYCTFKIEYANYLVLLSSYGVLYVSFVFIHL